MTDLEFNDLSRYCGQTSQVQNGFRDFIENRMKSKRDTLAISAPRRDDIVPLILCSREQADHIERMFEKYFKCSPTASTS